MATRIEDILLRARDTLADPEEERWSDARLIRLISEGQRDIAKHTKILKDEFDLVPLDGQAVYAIPDDVWMLTRATFQDCVIPFNSHDEMDELVRTQRVNQVYPSIYSSYGSATSDFTTADYCWEAETGDQIAAIIYDRRMPNSIKLFPVPTGDVFTFSDLFGVATDMQELELNSVYGVVTDIVDGLAMPIYGVTVAAQQFDGRLHFWYIKMPAVVSTVDDALELPEMWDTALKHYVISNAFDDDYDEKNTQKSQKALLYYERELGLIKETDSKDAIRKSQYRSDYRGAFE